jgi:hypothetical protein
VQGVRGHGGTGAVQCPLQIREDAGRSNARGDGQGAQTGTTHLPETMCCRRAVLSSYGATRRAWAVLAVVVVSVVKTMGSSGTSPKSSRWMLACQVRVRSTFLGPGVR